MSPFYFPSICQERRGCSCGNHRLLFVGLGDTEGQGHDPVV